MEDLPYPEVLPEIDPRWKTADVMGVARAIHADKAFDRLGLLADALQDAGCSDEVILHHLLGPPRTCPRCYGKKGWHAQPEGDWHDCSLCYATGIIRNGHAHTYTYHNPAAGCWERQCWLVNHLLGEPQPLRARARTSTGSNDEEYTGTAVNPGEFDGQVWRVCVVDRVFPPMYFVEARYIGDAEDIYIESDWGVGDRLTTEDLKDYLESPERGGENPEPPEYRCRWTGNGIPYDGESIQIDGAEGAAVPFPCMYYGPGLPKEGIHPWSYANKTTCLHCDREFYPRFPPPHGNILRRYTWSAGDYCSEACTQAAEGVPTDVGR